MKKIAVIGYGGQGRWHCEQIKHSDVVELAGTYDIREGCRQLAKSENVFLYDSNEAIFADKSVDIIVVATPNDVHEELSVKGLLSGHHVICEKPVTLSVESFDRIMDASKKSGKLFSVHQNRRWDAEYVAIKKIVDSKEIGDPIRVETRVQGSRGIPGDWRKHKEYGGGMIYDWGVHLIDQIISIFPEKIVCVDCVTTHITNFEVDDGFRMEVTFESGFTAHIEVSTYNFLKLPRFYMQCKEGTCLIPDWKKDVVIGKLSNWQEREVTPVQTSAGITKTMAPRNNTSLEEYSCGLPDCDAHDFYRNLCAAIEGKTEQMIKNSEVRRVLQIIETAFESDELGQRLTVEI